MLSSDYFFLVVTIIKEKLDNFPSCYYMGEFAEISLIPDWIREILWQSGQCRGIIFNFEIIGSTTLFYFAA